MNYNIGMNSLNPIPKFIEENISDLKSVFVFPTQTAANMWADWTITHTEKKAVPMERFIAWDDFKGSSIRSTHQNKTSIPGTMRTVFADNLLKKNSEEKFLSYIITKEYAENADGFVDWIAQILPSLSLWKKTFDEKNLDYDEEDKDLQEIYIRYKNFLDSHNLFDPAWETPPFDSNGKKFVIFFPEILMDYLEYKKILESTEAITLVHIPEIKDKPECRFYSNSRTELRQLCLRLKKIHDEKNIQWQDMAVNVFDLETWGPYLDREMNLYEIPHVQRNGNPLSSFSAGNLFNQIRDCVSQNFSYDSVKNLLLNTSLPWTDFNLNQRLVKFGKENNCICSFKTTDKNGNENKFDIWEESFKNPVDPRMVDEKIKNIYKSLKDILTAMVTSDSFEKIRSNYFTFRTKFFDVKKFTEQSDRIVSRCIAELGDLSDLENDFSDCPVSNHYNFFLKILDSKNYVPQNSQLGVQILPYRLSAPAPFKIQAILDSSQASISVVYRQLGFLDEEKRKNLGLAQESNVTEHFIDLYNICTDDETIFTAAEKTFTTYALTSAYLEEKDCRKKDEDNLDANDFYILEKESFLNDKKEFPQRIFKTEKIGFESWKKMETKDSDSKISDDAKKELDALMDKKLMRDKKVRITYSSLRSYFEDPHDFMLSKVFNLESENNVADLTPPFMIGNLNHKILENFCTRLIEEDLCLKLDDDGSLSENYRNILFESIDDAIKNIEETSALSRQIILSSKDSIKVTMLNAVTELSNKFQGYKIRNIEKEFKYYPEDKDYYFYGIVDCILIEPSSGQCVLIDFKTSDSAIHKNKFFVKDGVDVPDFQMPIYIHILENQEPTIEINDSAFFNISKADFVPFIGCENLCSSRSKPNSKSDLDLTMKTFLMQSEFYTKKVLEHNIESENPVEEFKENCHSICINNDGE